MQLSRESIDSEVKLGTKMVINWDMYLEMEREQIIIAHESGYEVGYIDNGKDGLTYYNETYRK